MLQYENLSGLTLNGYEDGREFDKTKFDLDRIEEIRAVVRKWLRKTGGINQHVSSYALKHTLERYMGRERLWVGVVNGYVSNGEMIFAMILEGFDVVQDGANAWFNISKIDFDALNVVGSLDCYQWHIAHTHVTLARIEEVEPQSKGEYSAFRYHITRKSGFSKYRNPFCPFVQRGWIKTRPLHYL